MSLAVNKCPHCLSCDIDLGELQTCSNL